MYQFTPFLHVEHVDTETYRYIHQSQVLGETSTVFKFPQRTGHFYSSVCEGKIRKESFQLSAHMHSVLPLGRRWLTWRMCEGQVRMEDRMEEVVELVKLGLCWFFFQVRLYPGCTSSFFPLKAACGPAQPRAEGHVCLIQALGVGKSFGSLPLGCVL